MSAGVFVDTWAWIAVFTRRDPGHEAAARAYAILRADRTRLVSSSTVIYETLEYVRRRSGAASALAVWSLFLAARGEALQVVCPDAADELAAMALAQKHGDQDLSVVDCLSFAMMERLGLSVAFTNDWHLRLQGFTCIPQ